MKTAISVPDATFERVERLADKLGMSRSEFYARAAARMADELEGAEVTDAIDRVLAGDVSGAPPAPVDDAAFARAAAVRQWARPEAGPDPGP